jgi:hypothetical protein
MAAITIHLDRGQLRSVQEELAGVRNGANRALSGAINKTLATGKTRIKRKLAEIIMAPQKTIMDGVSLKRARPDDNPQGSIIFKRKPMPLVKFKPKPQQTGAGVKVTVIRDKGQEEHPHWFVATMRNGDEGVFDRKPGPGPTGRVPRSPIAEKYGPTTVGVLSGRPGLLLDVERDLQGVLETNLASQVDRLLERPKSF